MKKIFLLSIIITQLVMSCSSNNEVVDDPTPQALADQIAAIIKQPYSKLTPSEQKIKLEAEANSMLVQMDKSKTSGAVEAMQNLGNLLSIGSVDIFNGKNDNQIEDILNVSGVYGIYTWNTSKQDWIKTTSTSELKFVFPAKKNLTTNNASFSSKSTSSNIKVEIQDSYNWQTGTIINDYFYLPTSADATLTIDSAQAATFSANAKYTGTVEAPDEAGYKMVLNDGYTYEISGGKKATANFAKSSFSYNGKNLISFNAGGTADIDALINDDQLTQYRGKANGLVQIMDNFLIVADMDIAGLASDEAVLDKTLLYPNDYNKKTYYSDQNTYYLKQSEGEVIANNKNLKLILVSKKDGTKIADVIQHSEKGDSYNTYSKWVTSNNNYGGFWDYDPNGGAIVQFYDTVLYLKFNDNTEVEMGAYFSTGFDTLETKFENFLKAFER
jgi:hypothetical protein